MKTENRNHPQSDIVLMYHQILGTDIKRTDDASREISYCELGTEGVKLT